MKIFKHSIKSHHYFDLPANYIKLQWIQTGLQTKKGRGTQSNFVLTDKITPQVLDNDVFLHFIINISVIIGAVLFPTFWCIPDTDKQFRHLRTGFGSYVCDISLIARFRTNLYVRWIAYKDIAGCHYISIKDNFTTGMGLHKAIFMDVVMFLISLWVKCKCS